MTVRQPTARTVARYGLTLAEWRRMLKQQGGTCGVCRTVPASGVLHIDHEHQPRWRSKPPEQRRLAVRGIVCWRCNSVWLRRGATPERLRAAADYLERYERRAK